MQPYYRFQRLISRLRRYDFQEVLETFFGSDVIMFVCGSSEAVVSRKFVIFLVVLVALALLPMLLFYFAQVFNTFSSLYHFLPDHNIASPLSWVNPIVGDVWAVSYEDSWVFEVFNLLYPGLLGTISPC